MINSRLVAVLDRVSSYFFLSLLWILFSLPVLTLPFSTLALFRTVRHWLKTGQYALIPLYPLEVKQAITSRFAIGILWLALGLLIVANLVIATSMPQPLQLAFLIMNILFMGIYATTSSYLLAVLAHFEVSGVDAMKLALYCSQISILTSIGALLVLFVTATAALVSPITLAVTAGITARVVYSLCSRSFPASTALSIRD